MEAIKLLRLLIIEDNPNDAELVLLEMRRNGYEAQHERVETADELTAALTEHTWDVIISDYSLPRFSAPAALKLAQEHAIDIPFIIVSGTVGEDTAVSAMKAGAHDFFAKNKLQRLVPAIERELREADLRRQRRIIEVQLLQSEERFAKAFQASPVGITIASEDGQFIDVNDYFLKLTGYERDEVIGRTSLQLALWSDLADHMQVEQMIVQWGAVRNVETQCRTRSGELRDVLASFEQIELGGQTCVLTLFHDITERKQAQDELKALYNATSYLFQANSVLSLGQQIVQAVVDEFGQVDCGLMLVDPKQNQMFRLARGGVSSVRTDAPLYLNGPGLVPEAVNRETEIYVPDVTADPRYVPNDPETKSELVIPLRTGKGVLGVLDLQSTRVDAFPERSRRVVTAFAERAAAAIEIIQLYEEINRYASELEWRVAQRTAELQRAKDQVETILNNSSDAIVVVDAGGNIQQANNSFTSLFGTTRGAAYGQSFNTLFTRDQIDALNGGLSSVVTVRETARIDLVARRNDGSTFDAEVAIAPVIEENEHELNLICSIRDITQRKQAEQELRKALEKEREVNELKSRFVSMVSHEFRTPLATILSSSEVLKMYKDRMPEEKQLQHLDRIHSQVRRMANLMDDVLMLSKAEAVGMPFTPTPTALESFCRDLLEDMALIAPNHPIEFTYEGDAEPVRIDRELIRQTLTNLISNAIKYSPAGSIIRFNAVRQPKRISFSVQDSGIGIPEEDQARLFQAFHRARNSANIQGTGLGLAIVKRAVEAHAGTISFESEVGVGTTFTVDIPLAGQDGIGSE